jgi:hypothetical protein
MISPAGRSYDSFFDVFFDIAVTDDWHLGPLSPVLLHPPDPGTGPLVESFFDVFFDVFEAGKSVAGAASETLFVNTQLDDGKIIDHRDVDANNVVSVGDYVLIEYTNGESVWYLVITTGTNGGAKSGAAVVDFFEMVTSIPPETPQCACDCHADPACDGSTDILDVVQTVNVAFRGAPAIIDPNVNCPYETTDVNCTNSTDVIDVVKMVNVAFRGANPATEFCNPCP